MFGAQKDDPPEIWRQLIEPAFRKPVIMPMRALRMAKNLRGSTGATALQRRPRRGTGKPRYKGIRTPHKMKFGVSGCTRECSEAQGKDVGIIATEKRLELVCLR